MRGSLPQCGCVLHISAVAQSSGPNGRGLLQLHRSLRQQSAFGIGIMTGSLLAVFDHYLNDPPKFKTLFRNVGVCTQGESLQISFIFSGWNHVEMYALTWI
jgi:hypothetical protein